MTINLPSTFDRICPLGLIEIVFEDIKISKHAPLVSPSKIPIWWGP